MSSEETEINMFMRDFKKRNPYEVEFHQAVENLVDSVMPWYLEQSVLKKAKILERLTEPDRVIMFRVSWINDEGEVHVNRGYRVQFNNTLGPYKGGLRFHPSVDLGILKFLGFEQTFKNSLTNLPMGGAKGGSDFNPKGRSDHEIMRFCQSFMTELYRHIGEDVDIPAGDIGVGAREIGYLFGHYKRLKNHWVGVVTGKNCSFGGSAVRKEATGFGCVYFSEHVLAQMNQSPKKLSAIISGSGNVALYVAQKALERGFKVLTLSDSKGFIHIKNGLNLEQLSYIIDLKENKRLPIAHAAKKFDRISYHKGKKPWTVPCDVAFPCATQNELNETDAQYLIDNGILLVCEGANMPLTIEAEHLLKHHKIHHAPGKASNAGGVAVSGLERSQNAMHMGWSKEYVDGELQTIMEDIHQKCITYGISDDWIDYVKGANIAGFEKVARGLHSFGVN